MVHDRHPVKYDALVPLCARELLASDWLGSEIRVDTYTTLIGGTGRVARSTARIVANNICVT